MSLLRPPARWFLLVLAASALLSAQTTVNINNTVIQSPVKRFGINLGTPNFYDSGQMTKNLVYTTNPSFEGEIYQSTIQCGSGTANSCSDSNVYSGFPTSFWLNASYTVITGASAGRSGTICSFSGANYPANGGVYTFCDSGTAPANGDYMVVKTTLPPDVGWPIGGDWLTTAGAGSFTAETTDLPPGTLGKQSGLLTAPTANDSVSVNMFFDSTATKSFVQLNGPYQITFKAKGVSANSNIVVKLTRGSTTFLNQTEPLSNTWNTYSIPFTGSENGSALGKVELSFLAAGPDTVELDDVSLVQTNTDPTNTTIFRDEVVAALQGAKPGVLRYWVDQLGDSLDNLLAPATGRQRSGYTPYAGYDGTNITLVGGVPTTGTYQTQSVKVGLTEFLQLSQKVGADPWIVVPSTFSTGEAYNLIDYLAGDGTTTYGAIRIASGQTAPWTSVFNVIHLEFGNEEWNGGTFKGGALENGSLSYSPYGERASAIFASVKGNPGYTHSKFDLIINGQSASPYSNYFTQLYSTNNDSFSIAPYMMYNINQWATVDHLFGTTFAEAEAFVTPGASAEGVSGGYITAEQTGTGKPIVTSEMNLSPTGTPSSGGDGPMTQAAMNGYASSVGGGLAVMDSMFQQLRAGVLTQNLFALPGWEVATQTNTTAFLWGGVVDMGVTNRKRPQYLALQLANNAIGSKTQMLQTQHAGLDPTDNQYNYGLNSVSLPTFHFLQSFAFTDGAGNYSLVVFNVSPDYPETINFGGAVQPSGTVNVQQLTSANITDTNETSNLVSVQSIPFASTMTLPAYSMTTFTWGGSAQAGPKITSVQATNITANSATITWTTDQPSSSQVNYGTTTSYGSQSALNSTLTTAHSITISGLTPGTTYHFDVVSANGSNASSTSPDATFATTTAAPVLSNVQATAITTTSATITWTSDQASSSTVNYGTTTSYGSTATGTGNVTSHSVSLTGLTANTTYHFAVTSVNAANGSTTSTDQTFTTTAGNPVISLIAASSITSNSGVITWTTDQSSSSTVNYGTTTSYGSTATGTGNVTSHSVSLTGLQPSTTYHFKVTSVNAANGSSTSTDQAFTTTAAAAPVISAVTATAITTTSAVITWTTDQSSTSVVNYGATTAYGSQATTAGSSATHSVTLSNLTPGTTYNFDVVSANSSNVSATSSNYTFTTTAGTPVLSAVTATAITSTSVTVTWTTDQPSTSQVAYGTTTAYGSTTPLITTLSTSHSVSITGLTPNTTYDFQALSSNSANTQGKSANATFTTSQTAAPVISNVAAGSITTSSATISWTTDQSSSSTVNYGTTTAYGSAATGTGNATTHSVTLSNLTPGTIYNFDVVSANSSNVPATSSNYTFTTTAAGGGGGGGKGPVISSLAAWPVSDTTATILWVTDQPATSQVNYGATTAYGSQTQLDTTLNIYHAVQITGLTPGTTYHYAVSTTDSAGASTSPDGNFTTTGTAPASPGPVISAVTTSGLTTTGVTITWTTDVASSSQVSYGTTTAYGSTSPLNSISVTAHSVTLSGLTPGTTYDFDVTSTTSGGGVSSSANFTFTTTAVAGSGPKITSVAAWPVGNNTATILWVTDVPASSQVNYGTTTSYGTTTQNDPTLNIYHAVSISGLNPGTTYHFDVVSTATGNTSTSPDWKFTTTGTAPSNPGPVISAVATSGITATTATVIWTTDLASSSLVSYGATTAYGSTSPTDATPVTSHSVTLSGLTAGTLYDFTVTSVDSNGSSTSTNQTFTTASATPTAPIVTQIASSAITTTSATITWTTDQPASSQVFYGPSTGYGQQTAVNSSLVTSHSVTLTGLTPGTTYDFAVVSANSSSQSTASGNNTFATPATAGPAISSLAVWPIGNNTATVEWVTDQSSTSQVKYGTTSAYGQQTTVNSTLAIYHAVGLSNLLPGTTYHYSVVSTDSSAVTSTSPDGTFTTTGTAPTTGPVISAVTATNITNASATITWTTDSASNSQIDYGPTTALGAVTPVDSNLVTAHSETITGLTPGTIYYFTVFSMNAQGGVTTSSQFTFTTTGSLPAPVISAVVSWGVTGNSAIIGWSTDQLSDSQVLYGTTNSLGQSTPVQSTLTNSHAITLTGLSGETTYYFQVRSANSVGSAALSSISNFTTVNTVGPVISNVVGNPAAGNAASVAWMSSEPVSIQVEYGRDTTYGWWTAPNTTSPTALGWTPSGTVHFRIHATDSNSLTTVTQDYTFVEP